MNLLTCRVVCLPALLVVTLAAADAQAVGVVVAKTENLLQNSSDSPFFTTRMDGTELSDSNGWEPESPRQAAAATTLDTTPKKSFTIVGDSTAAGNWVDGNGIPAGITLTFDAKFTITGLPTNSILTTPGSALFTSTPNQTGIGLGVTQVEGGPNDINTGHGLSFSAVTVENMRFTGTLTDTAYQFNNGNVSGFGTVLFRSNNFDETGSETVRDGMVLTQGTDTIGFGTATGSLASNLIVDNNFGSTSSFFPRQSGPYTLVVTENVSVIKGMTLQYDVTYDISPATTEENADFDGDNDIDGADFLIWQRNVALTTGATPSQGNANPAVDGAVNGDDLAIWKDQFGTAVAAAQAIPEPAGAALFVVGAMAMVAARRRA